MEEEGCAGSGMWVGERCFRPARNAGAAGGYRESALQGSTGSRWEPLTAGLGSLWGGLSPLHRHSFPGGLCTPDQARVRPSAGPSAPRAALQGPQKTSPGYQNLAGAGGQVWGMPPPGSPRGGHHGPGRGEVVGLHVHPTLCLPSPPAPSPLRRLCAPRGHPAPGRGVWGLSGVPGPGLCRRDGANPPRPGHRSRDAPGPAERHGGMRAARCGRQPRSPRGRRGCPVKNAPPARTERHEAGSRVGPRPPFPVPALSPLLPVLPARRRAAAGTGRGIRCVPVPMAPRARKAKRGAPGEEGTPQAAQPRDAPAARDRPAPGTSGGGGEAAGPSPRCGLPVPPVPGAGSLSSVQCPSPPVGCP
ncbi:uncharacterized protein ACIBXB_018420 [Morphnus guianensis]